MFARKLNALKYKGAEKLDLTNEGNILVFLCYEGGLSGNAFKSRES